MFCDNCGKNNTNAARKCVHCGAPLAGGFATSGFSDILSYKPETSAYPSPSSGGVSEDMVRSVGIKANQAIRAAEKAKLYSLVSVAVSVILLITTIIVAATTNKAVNKVENDFYNHNDLYHKEEVPADTEIKDDKDDKDDKKDKSELKITDENGELESFRLEDLTESDGDKAEWEEGEFYVKRIIVENTGDTPFDGTLKLESENDYTDVNGLGLADVVGVYFVQDENAKIDKEYVKKIKEKGKENSADGFRNIKNTFSEDITVKAGEKKEYILIFCWDNESVEFEDEDKLKATVTVKVESAGLAGEAMASTGA